MECLASMHMCACITGASRPPTYTLAGGNNRPEICLSGQQKLHSRKTSFKTGSAAIVPRCRFGPVHRCRSPAGLALGSVHMRGWLQEKKEPLNPQVRWTESILNSRLTRGPYSDGPWLSSVSRLVRKCSRLLSTCSKYAVCLLDMRF